MGQRSYAIIPPLFKKQRPDFRRRADLSGVVITARVRVRDYQGTEGYAVLNVSESDTYQLFGPSAKGLSALTERTTLTLDLTGETGDVDPTTVVALNIQIGLGGTATNTSPVRLEVDEITFTNYSGDDYLFTEDEEGFVVNVNASPVEGATATWQGPH